MKPFLTTMLGLVLSLGGCDQDSPPAMPPDPDAGAPPPECTSDSDCDDLDLCNGAERCEAESCTTGAPAAVGSSCDADGDPSTFDLCIGGTCRPTDCGDSYVDDRAGEECDDGNDADGDGCDVDCTFSCHDDTECMAVGLCDIPIVCDPSERRCVAAPLGPCDDEDACTEDGCDPDTGDCTHTLVDEDGDMHAPMTLGACGTDCDDGDPNAYGGATPNVELCDGADNDCDGFFDEGTPSDLLLTFWADCDGDGFAVASAASALACMQPTGVAPGCTERGTWTEADPTDPDANSEDCNDGNPDVYPGTPNYHPVPIPGALPGREWDYDCSNTHDKRYSLRGSCSMCPAGEICPIGGCSGTPGYIEVPACGEPGSFTVCVNDPDPIPHCAWDVVDPARTQECK